MTNNYTPQENKRLYKNQGNLPRNIFLVGPLVFIICLFLNSTVNGQANASFTIDIDEGCSPLMVTFTNTSTGTDLSFDWIYGDGNRISTIDPGVHSHPYNNGGSFNVMLIATELANPGSPDTTYATINVTQTVSADLMAPLPPGEVCANEWFNLHWNTSYSWELDSVIWIFGDGRTFKNEDRINPVSHKYNTNGNYTVQYITYNTENGKVCNDTSNRLVTVAGPIAEFTVAPDSVCIGETVTYTVTNSTGVTQYRWNTAEGGNSSGWIVGDNNPFQYEYSTALDKTVELELESASKTCILTDTVHIYQIVAGIDYSTATCSKTSITYIDASIGIISDYYWDFGNGKTSTKSNDTNTYATEDEYVVSHMVANTRGCADTVYDTIYAYTPPVLALTDTAWFICRGDSAQLGASGGDSISWIPDYGLSDASSYNPKASPNYSEKYSVTIADLTTRCTTTDKFWVYVQQNPDWNSIIINPPDTSIIIGDTVFIQVDEGDYNYSWSPDYQVISCLDCPNFTVLPLQTTTYTLDMSDTLGCFSNQFEVPVEVREEYRIGVPEAFTPNGDGINDFIYVNGWGIKSIVEFRVYNRWGKEVFFSDSPSVGWDGNIDGKPAAIDTYAYVVKAEMWSGETIVENGTFTLIR